MIMQTILRDKEMRRLAESTKRLEELEKRLRERAKKECTEGLDGLLTV